MFNKCIILGSLLFISIFKIQILKFYIIRMGNLKIIIIKLDWSKRGIKITRITNIKKEGYINIR